MVNSTNGGNTEVKIFNSLYKRFFLRKHLRCAKEDLITLANHCMSPQIAVGIAYAWRGQGYFQSLDMKQSAPELLALIDLLTADKVSRIVEIGSHKGGTLFVWSQLVKKFQNAQLISIDLPGGEFGGGHRSGHETLFDSFCKEGQQLKIIRGDSHDPSVVKLCSQSLQHPVDFLFIDGDHSYAGVKLDYENFKQFVKPGGLIGFHDIIRRDDKPEIEVWRFWDELVAKHPGATKQFVATEPTHRKIGIGVLRYH